eukprot:symbB.v1.2.036630.t1/scaffold5213.1/size29773/3
MSTLWKGCLLTAVKCRGLVSLVPALLHSPANGTGSFAGGCLRASAPKWSWLVQSMDAQMPQVAGTNHCCKTSCQPAFEQFET